MKNYYKFVFFTILILHQPFERLKAQCTATTVPYYEDFLGITQTNELPACWTASNPSVTCLTFTTPNKYAAFYYNPGGQNYFYSRGLQLVVGVTYSAALFYKTDNTGNLNWTNLSILVGTGQTPTGLTPIASSGGPASSATYTLLSGLFTVPLNGVYYIAIRGTGSNTAASQYLMWDDLSVTIPCTPGSQNVPILTPTNMTVSMCQGQTVTINGSSSGPVTYYWSTGATTPTVSVSPFLSSPLQLTLTNTVTNCASTFTYYLDVNQAPVVTVSANSTVVCAGQPVVLSASAPGVTIFSWSTGAVGATKIVTPNANTTYSVTGVNSAGCTNTASISIAVLPLPNITAVSSSSVICMNESVNLTASGGLTYTWMPAFVASTLVVSPGSTKTYTVLGIGTNSCANTATVLVTVEECTGDDIVGLKNSEIQVYPNPVVGECILKISQGEIGSLKMLDISGKTVFEKSIDNEETKVDMQEFAKGMYFFIIETNGHLEFRKVVKE